MCSTSAAQDQTRFVLKLDNDLISSFRNFQSLRSNVPPEFKGKISLVELQFPDTKDNPAVEMDLGLTLDGDKASMEMNEQAILMLKAQPLRVPVAADKNQFSQIVLIYTPSEATPAIATMPETATAPGVTTTKPKVDATAPDMNASVQSLGTYFVRIGESKTMSGTMDEFVQFEMQTNFGTVTIPSNQISGIKFHIDNIDSAVVVLINGDSITGIPGIETLNLTTDWGLADIDLSSVNSVTTIPSANFSQENTDSGTRWVLKTGAAVASENVEQGGQVR
jgi:hypothetical protein